MGCASSIPAGNPRQIPIITYLGPLSDGEYFNSVPLITACTNPNLDVLRHMIITEKANPNVVFYANGPRSYGRKHPLSIACTHNNIDAVKLLLAHNVDVNVQIDGETPLYIACAKSNYELVEILLEAGAIIGASNQIIKFGTEGKNNDCLDIAPTNIKRLLVEKGAKIQENHIISVGRGSDIDLLQLYIDKGIPLSNRCLLRVNSTNIEITKLMLQHGIKISENCLVHALENSTYEIVKLLLDHGAIVTPVVLSATARLPPSEHSTLVTKLIIEFRNAQTISEPAKSIDEKTIAIGEPICGPTSTHTRTHNTSR